MVAIKNFGLLLLGLILLLFIGAFVFLAQMFRLFFQDTSHSEYIYAVAIGLDQLGGSIIYGKEDWCISSWTYYLAMHKENMRAFDFMELIDALFWENHCKESFVKEANELNFRGVEDVIHLYKKEKK